MPIVDKLIGEGIEITKLETWHNPENATLFENLDKGLCGGVPLCFDDKTGKSICGEASDDEVRKWAFE